MGINTKRDPTVSDAFGRSKPQGAGIPVDLGVVCLRVFLGLSLAALVAAVGEINSVAGQAYTSPPVTIVAQLPASDTTSDASGWTVLTMAPDGSWGVATEMDSGRAIARAIANCKKMYKKEIGCGASLTTISAGWSLAIRCGSENIIVAEKNLADAEKAALQRENALRVDYVSDLPACKRVLTVDPHGVVVMPDSELGSAGESTVETELRSRSLLHSPLRRTAGQVPIWKTITLGTYRSVNVLREALASARCGVGYGIIEIAGRLPVAVEAERPGTPPCHLGVAAGEIIGRPAFTLSKTKTDVDLVVLSVFELGLGEEKNLSLKDIYARALSLGFALCPAEVGPQLRLQYLDQPTGELLHVAMQPVAQYDGQLIGLEVANGGAGLLLIGGDARPDVAVPSSVRFAFVRPR
ncbi:MAG: hypothetical protein ACLPKB_30250 [Xanthobacteraceae bacterium]